MKGSSLEEVVAEAEGADGGRDFGAGVDAGEMGEDVLAEGTGGNLPHRLKLVAGGGTGADEGLGGGATG